MSVNGKSHFSRHGIEEDDMGFVFVTCDCGEVIGPAPDVETVLDAAMEHAWQGGVDASEAQS